MYLLDTNALVDSFNTAAVDKIATIEAIVKRLMLPTDSLPVSNGSRRGNSN